MSEHKLYIIGNHNLSGDFQRGSYPVVFREQSNPRFGADIHGGGRWGSAAQRAIAMVRGLLCGARVIAGAFANDAAQERIEREKSGLRMVNYWGLPGG
ncbi:MAG: hypothetical protein O7A08_10105 [SAR324 cluster bacterium]|nr:hypothetical protein [SAR324 cluster bacterium]